MDFKSPKKKAAPKKKTFAGVKVPDADGMISWETSSGTPVRTNSSASSILAAENAGWKRK